MKHGTTLSNGAGLYAYLGISDYRGAAQQDSPAYFGRTWSVDWDGTGATTYGPNDEVNEGLARFNQAYLDRPKLKAHVQYTHDGWDVWVRHTSGGGNHSPTHSAPAKRPATSRARCMPGTIK